MTDIKKYRGFTLLEMVVVLLLLGIFSSVLYLRIQNVFSGGDLRSASRMIIGRINMLRGRAVFGRTEQTMVLHIDRNTVYAVEPESAEQSTVDRAITDPRTSQKETPLPRGVRLEDVVVLSRGKIRKGEALIRFFANGCIDRSLIHLRNDGDESYTLEINPLTGNVKVYDRYHDY
jgi:prepilin-type N-terminal cleavage/methylation domain-containing protein